MADKRMQQMAQAIQGCLVKGDEVDAKEYKKSITIKVKTGSAPVDYKVIIMEDK